jgi:hypothetical protein
MRASYLRVVTLYIHLFGVNLASTFLRENQALFGTFIPPRAAALLARRCTPVQSTPRKPDRAALRPSILNLNALVLLILNATGLSLTCELPQLFLGHQMA